MAGPTRPPGSGAVLRTEQGHHGERGRGPPSAHSLVREMRACSVEMASPARGEEEPGDQGKQWIWGREVAGCGGGSPGCESWSYASYMSGLKNLSI